MKARGRMLYHYCGQSSNRKSCWRKNCRRDSVLLLDTLRRRKFVSILGLLVALIGTTLVIVWEVTVVGVSGLGWLAVTANLLIIMASQFFWLGRVIDLGEKCLRGRVRRVW